MNTYPEHLGNELAKCTDEDLKRVLLQFMKRRGYPETGTPDTLMHMYNILSTNSFDYTGNIPVEAKELKLNKNRVMFNVEVSSYDESGGSGKESSESFHFRNLQDVWNYMNGFPATDFSPDSLSQAKDMEMHCCHRYKLLYI